MRPPRPLMGAIQSVDAERLLVIVSDTLVNLSAGDLEVMTVVRQRETQAEAMPSTCWRCGS